MRLTTVEGMQSEIFVPVTPVPVFTELKKPLSECKVALSRPAGYIKRARRRSIHREIIPTARSNSIRRLRN